MKTQETIDLTPSWKYATEIYISVLQNPDASEEGKQGVYDEMRRMAKALDQFKSQEECKEK